MLSLFRGFIELSIKEDLWPYANGKREGLTPSGTVITSY